MRIVIISPPMSDPTRPHLSSPMLCGILKNAGYEDLRQFDFGLEAFLYLLDPDRLQESVNQVGIKLDNLDGMDKLCGGDQLKWAEFVRAKVSGDYIVRNIQDAIACIRNRKKFDVSSNYIRSIGIIQRAEELASARFYPNRFYAPGNYSSEYDAFSSEDLILAASDASTNIFFEYFQDQVIPRITAEKPYVIFLGLNHTGQIIPAVTLTKLLRKSLLGTHLHLWGNYAYYFQNVASNWKDFIDPMISIAPHDYEYGVGETSIGLVRALHKGTDLMEVPGIYFMDSKGQIIFTGMPREPDNLNALSHMQFDGLPLKQYLVPDLVLPTALTLGCYWGKCTFCTRRRHFLQRNPAEVITQMVQMHERFGASRFYLSDDCIPPSLMITFCRLLLESKHDFKWYCMLRPVRSFNATLCDLMARAGCQFVMLGVESASQRMLDLMGKGTNITHVRDVLQNLSIAGISVILSTFIGFPTETEKEARQTLKFVIESKQWVQDVMCGRFLLQVGTPIYKSPEHFGINRIIRQGHTDHNLWFSTESGMTRERVMELHEEFQQTIQKTFPRQNLQVQLLEHSDSAHTLLRAETSFGKANYQSKTIGTTYNEDRPCVVADHVSILKLRFPCEQLFGKGGNPNKDVTSCNAKQKRHSMKVSQHKTENEIQPQDSYCLYCGPADKLMHINQSLVNLLQKCDGTKTLAQIYQNFPESKRETVKKTLYRLLSERILSSTVLV